MDASPNLSFGAPNSFRTHRIVSRSHSIDELVYTKLSEDACGSRSASHLLKACQTYGGSCRQSS